MCCYSHPNKKLIEHLENVKNIGISIFDKKRINISSFEFYKIRKTLEISLRYHDIGKATTFFQDYLKAAISGKVCQYSQELINHSLLSACIVGYKILKETKNNTLSAFGFSIVRKHHGNLEKFDSLLTTRKKDILKKQFDSLNISDFSELEELDFEKIWEFVDDLIWIKYDKNIEYYILLNFLFSILIYADKVDVILGNSNNEKIPIEIDKFIDDYKYIKFKREKYSILNNIRENIYFESLKNLKNKYKEYRIFSLNVPTGAGKTLTSLNLAFNLIKIDNNVDRIIYALPFTSIVDQTEKIIKEIFEKKDKNAIDYLIVHHHLADIKVKLNENLIEGDKAQFLIENWDKPIILTTFWQLFYTIFSNVNAQLRKFHNLANSIIILDEVQTIPYKYWDLINVVFKKISDVLNCKIIFLTATMPLIFREDKNEILSLIKKDNRDKYFKIFSRYKIELLKENNSIKLFTIDELIKISKNDIMNNLDKNFLFIFNTIKSSLMFYSKIKELFPEKKIVYLSSNILPIERKKRIEIIKKNKNIPMIVVSTQLIEAGVDIDLDIIYRDFAPLDSLIQTAGRCNRNNKREKGKVVIFKLKNESDKLDCSYIYKGLILNETEKIFKKEKYNESDLINIIRNYFEIIKNNSSQDESKDILKYIKDLNYDKINEFKLIDEIPSFLIFIEYDKEASKVLKEFKEIIKIKNRFDRKSAFLKIKQNFYEYILSVKFKNSTKSLFTSFEDIGNLKIIKYDYLDMIYDKETGLKYEWSYFI